MNCEKCLAQLNAFFDGELSPTECATLELHLSVCQSCADAQDDLMAILDCCVDLREESVAPPNAQALWLRISNLIESEQSAICAKDAQAAAVAARPKPSFWQRASHQTWRFSLQQVASGVIGIAVITALLTVVGLQNMSDSSKNPAAAQAGFFTPFFGEKPAADKFDNNKHLELETRLQKQQVAIDYWTRRVDQRKRQWNRHIQEAFDRNLREIDGVVVEYQQYLSQNPHDDVSEEMLDTALQDKMELLREFAEL